MQVPVSWAPGCCHPPGAGTAARLAPCGCHSAGQLCWPWGAAGSTGTGRGAVPAPPSSPYLFIAPDPSPLRRIPGVAAETQTCSRAGPGAGRSCPGTQPMGTNGYPRLAAEGPHGAGEVRRHHAGLSPPAGGAGRGGRSGRTPVPPSHSATDSTEGLASCPLSASPSPGVLLVPGQAPTLPTLQGQGKGAGSLLTEPLLAAGLHGAGGLGVLLPGTPQGAGGAGQAPPRQHPGRGDGQGEASSQGSRGRGLWKGIRWEGDSGGRALGAAGGATPCPEPRWRAPRPRRARPVTAPLSLRLPGMRPHPDALLIRAALPASHPWD